MMKKINYSLMVAIPISFAILMTGCATNIEKEVEKAVPLVMSQNSLLSSLTIKFIEIKSTRDYNNSPLSLANEINKEINDKLAMGQDLKDVLNQYGKISSELTTVFNDVKQNEKVSYNDTQRKEYISAQEFTNDIKTSEKMSTIEYGLKTDIFAKSNNSNEVMVTLSYTDTKIISMDKTMTGLESPTSDTNFYQGTVTLNNNLYKVAHLTVKPIGSTWFASPDEKSILKFVLIKVNP